MKHTRVCAFLGLISLFFGVAVQAQQGPAPAAPARHGERLVKFSGALKDRLGRPLTGVVGLTFALYKDQQDGAPLWLETQNVELDEQGRYTVLLGATQSEGLALELFTSGEPRWLGVQVILPGVEEEPRVLLVSVPYALKAADAETLGGKPLEAFVLAEVQKGEATAGPTKALQTGGPGPVAVTSGTTNFLGKFVNSTDLGNSLIFDSGTAVGIGTTSLTEALTVNGNILLKGQPLEVLQVIGADSSGRLGQDANGFFFASDTTGKSVRFLTSNGTLNEWMSIASNGNVRIGTGAPGAKLDVAGNVMVSGTGNGIMFPDGTTQTTAAAQTGELVLVMKEEFDNTLSPVDWTVTTTGTGVGHASANLLELCNCIFGGPVGWGAKVTSNKQFALSNGTLVFKAKLRAYQDTAGVYGDFQPRGLVAGTDRNNAIEFISASPSSVFARTVSGGVATQTTATIGDVYVFHVYQIVATASSVKFYVNGTLIATHTTNIPTAALNVYFSTGQSDGNGNVPHLVDYVSFEIRQ